MTGAPGRELASARREVDNVDTRVSVGDWKYDESISRWCLPFDISLHESRAMPLRTSWILTVEERYPTGEVRVWPAREGGITDTYPHQLNNGLKPYGSFCRSGRLCLFGEGSEEGVPADADFKAAHFVEKAVEWVDCANAGTLMDEGEHLELPAFDCPYRLAVMYIEDEITKMMWDAAAGITAGLARVRVVEDGLWALVGFSFGEGLHAIEPPWGEVVIGSEIEHEAIWVLANEIPSVNLWQAPNNFSELRAYLSRCGIDLDEVVARFGAGFRDGNRHLFLMGVPVPEYIGGQADHLTWFTFLMPTLMTKGGLGKGAMGKPSTLKVVDKVKVFAGDVKVDWVLALNVAKRQLHSRGSLCETLIESDVLVIGAGSLGSLVCEALVRGGVSSIAVSDSDVFSPGNVTRHVLGFDATGKRKARELCKRLNSISPNVEAMPLSAAGAEKGPCAAHFDLIVDCSGSVKVLDWIEEAKTKKGTMLAVFSFGIGARSVYSWTGPASGFTRAAYDAKFADRVKADLGGAEELSWEGTGCWSPVFPAQHADVAMAAAVCVKALDARFCSGDIREDARVFEFQYDPEGNPLGMRSVEP